MVSVGESLFSDFSNLGLNAESLEGIKSSGQERPLKIIQDIGNAIKNNQNSAGPSSSISIEKLIQLLSEELQHVEGMEEYLPDLKSALKKMRLASSPTEKSTSTLPKEASSISNAQPHIPINFISPATSEEASDSPSLSSLQDKTGDLGGMVSSLTIEISTFQQMTFTGKDGQEITITQASYTRIEMHSAGSMATVGNKANEMVGQGNELSELMENLKEIAENLEEILEENKEEDTLKFEELLMAMLAKILEQMTTFSELVGADQAASSELLEGVKEGNPDSIGSYIEKVLNPISQTAQLPGQLANAGESQDAQAEIHDAVASQIEKVSTQFVDILNHIMDMIPGQEKKASNELATILDSETPVSDLEGLEALLSVANDADITDSGTQEQIQEILLQFISESRGSMETGDAINEFLDSVSTLVEQSGLGYLEMPTFEDEEDNETVDETSSAEAVSVEHSGNKFPQEFSLRDTISARPVDPVQNVVPPSNVATSNVQGQQSQPGQDFGGLESILEQIIEQMMLNSMNHIGPDGPTTSDLYG